MGSRNPSEQRPALRSAGGSEPTTEVVAVSEPTTEVAGLSKPIIAPAVANAMLWAPRKRAGDGSWTSVGSLPQGTRWIWLFPKPQTRNPKPDYSRPDHQQSQ